MIIVDAPPQNAGSSTGTIDNYLAKYCGHMTGVDIDEHAVHYANKTFGAANLEFRLGDGLPLDFRDNSFDIEICAQVYEHVADPDVLMSKIFRVLKPDGVCYFSANTRCILQEPHYHCVFPILAPAEVGRPLHADFWRR